MTVAGGHSRFDLELLDGVSGSPSSLTNCSAPGIPVTEGGTA